MNKYLLIVFVFLFDLAVYAQETNSSVLYWQSKKLEWNDFKGIPNKQSIYGSELKYFIGFSLKDKKYDNINFRSFTTFAYIDKNSSWVKSSFRSEKYLIYNQTIFNICELYSRYLELELNNLVGPMAYITAKANELLMEYSSRNTDRITEFQISTNFGQDTQEVKRWYTQIDSELNEYPRNIIPDYELSNNGIGGSFDLGYGMLFGNLNSYFSNGPSFSFGFEYLHKPFIFYLRGTLNGNKVLNTFSKENRIWTKGLSSGLALINFSLGYPIIENKYNSLIPFAGLTLAELSITNKDEQYKNHQLLTYTGIFGLIYDYNFYTTINFLGTELMRYKTDWFIRTRLYFVPLSYDQDLHGYSINLTIGIGGLSNFLK